MDFDLIAELTDLGYKYEYSGENLRTKCPFHDDYSPSCYLYPETKTFQCFAAGCEAKGNYLAFFARVGRTDINTAKKYIAEKYGVSEDKTIRQELPLECHQRIWDAGKLLSELRKRGIEDSTISKYKLGERNGRITFPVPNEQGFYVNLRQYLPNAAKGKVKNFKGYSKSRLYPIDQLAYEEIVITAGEVKALAGIQTLNPEGIGCLTATAGEGNWDAAFTKKFSGKRVYIIYDIDDAGVTSAINLAKQIVQVAEWCGIVDLRRNESFSSDLFPKGGLDDFLVNGHDILKLLKECPEYVFDPSDVSLFDPHEEVTSVSLTKAVSAEHTGKKIQFDAVISCAGQTPALLPKRVKIECPKDQDFCGICPVNLTSDEAEVHPESISILELLESNRRGQNECVREVVGIPTRCRLWKHKTLQFFNVEDLRVSPQLEITNTAVERHMQPAVIVTEQDQDLEMNEPYQMEGRTWPSPTTQAATVVLSRAERTSDALSTYQLREYDKLKVFQPEEWTTDALKSHLKSLYDDLEANVTRVFERRAIHILYDLAWHSPLFINFDHTIHKGWVEVIVVGDSSCGKSQTMQMMRKHYGLGEIVECKGVTEAGLKGGLQKINDKWFVTWGTIPTHDRRLVILEELKGTSSEVFGKLTDMRSSGVAQLTKIEKRRAHARTRLIAISNPRSVRPVSSYTYGLETIRELIGSPEDIRRFDAGLVVDKDEVDITELQTHRPEVDHRFTASICRELILWAWTRKATVFEDEKYVLKKAIELSSKFTEEFPLVDKGSIRLKIARLSSSVAARSFSHLDDGELFIRNCHVDYVCQFLEMIYSSSTFGYLQYSQNVLKSEQLANPKEVEKRLRQLPNCSTFVECLLTEAVIDFQTIRDALSEDAIGTNSMLSFLYTHRALRRTTGKQMYRKTAAFVKMLKKMQEEGIKDMPDHLAGKGV